MEYSPSSKKFLSRKETAELLGISLPTIARRINDGSIPRIKLGGRILIPTYAIEQLIEQALAREAS